MVTNVISDAIPFQTFIRIFIILNSQEHRKTMPINPLDAVVIGITLISAVLAAVRGATREILAIVSWFVAGLAAYLLHEQVKPLVLKHISNDVIALVASVAGVFLITLLVVSFITVKISDMVLDSRIGALDRTLGFLFGVLRGFLLCIIGWALLSWFLQGQDPKWATEARTFSVLESSSNTLKNNIPEDFLKMLKQLPIPGMDGQASGNETPADTENAQRPVPTPAQ